MDSFFPFYYLFIYLFIYFLVTFFMMMMMILVCDIETGQSNVILDIEESRGPRKFIFLKKFDFKFSNFVL